MYVAKCKSNFKRQPELPLTIYQSHILFQVEINYALLDAPDHYHDTIYFYEVNQKLQLFQQAIKNMHEFQFCIKKKRVKVFINIFCVFKQL